MSGIKSHVIKTPAEVRIFDTSEDAPGKLFVSLNLSHFKKSANFVLLCLET